jgi:glycosyltransferase involved in cell wall biosynthesis
LAGDVKKRFRQKLEPLVSVICITRNHERFCIESLDSVLDQTYKNIEWIILDAASTDSTVKLIDNWLVDNNVSAVFLKEKELKPVTVNANKALTYANGEYVQFLSLDDVLCEDKIIKNVKCLMQLPSDYCAVYSDAFVIDEKNSLRNESFIAMHRDFDVVSSGNVPLFEILCSGNFIPMMSMIFRTSSINKIHGFDERLDYEDYDLHLRLTKTNKYYFLQQRLVKYRVHGNNLHLNLNKNLRDDVLIFFKHLDSLIGRKRFLNKLSLSFEDHVKEDLSYIQQQTELPRILFYISRINKKVGLRIIRKITEICGAASRHSNSYQ